MLSLTFKNGDSVMIGDDMEIFVEDIHGGRARLRFKTVDKSVPIWRREIWEQMQLEKPPDPRK